MLVPWLFQATARRSFQSQGQSSVGGPPAGGTASRVNSSLLLRLAPTAIKLPSGDHEGLEKENLSGCWREASSLSPDPSTLATISASRCCPGKLRTKAISRLSGERAT